MSTGVYLGSKAVLVGKQEREGNQGISASGVMELGQKVVYQPLRLWFWLLPGVGRVWGMGWHKCPSTSELLLA